MAITNFTPSLGLAKPTQGDLVNTWGDAVNDYISQYVDIAVAGALTVSANTTLTQTQAAPLGSTSSQYAILIASGHSTNITITAPALSKTYIVINTSGSYTVTVCGAGPTTGVVIGVSENALVAWNGSDFVRIGAADNSNTVQTFTNKTISVDNNTINGVAASSFVMSTAGGAIDGAAAQKAIPSGAVVGTTDSQTLTNKTISVDSNTVEGIAASSFVLSTAGGAIDGSAAQKAIPAGAVVGTTDSQTLTNKTIDYANNTLTGVVGTTATQTLTNKTIEDATFTNGYIEESVTANTGTAYTINLANGTLQILTLTGNCTFTFPTATAGRSFMLLLKQDGTGGRTVTWPAAVKWPGNTAPTITSTASRLDKYVFTADGTNWYGSNGGQNYTV